jgi:hypothetical protein
LVFWFLNSLLWAILRLVLFSIFTLLWQLFVLFACCLGVGSILRFLLPKEFSLLNKVLFSLTGGLFLVVLIAQNLVYVGMPVRISAWFTLAIALVQVCLCRHQLLLWMRLLSANADLRTLAAVIILIITFHGIVPIRQGLEWYYGKGYDDQLNYVLLAEFLKEEPYRTSTQDVPLRPWMVRAAGYQDTPEQVAMNPGKEAELIGIKEQRIGQSIITAEISVWSGTDGKSGYAATVIFFITLLAICLYVVLRETGTDRFLAGSGALLAALLPAVTRLSLDGFLSQTSILFAFPFFVSLLRRHELSARSFTLFFSLTLAYFLAAYSELAPIGICTFFLGVMFVRDDKMRPKRLILMGAIILVILMNPFYLRNLIGFLGRQYYMAGNAPFLAHMAPNILTLRSWSELIFGAIPSAPFALFFDYCAVLLCLLFLAGAILLSRRDKLIFGAILLPVIFVICFFASWNPPSYFPIAKAALTILPFAIGLVFVSLSKIAANSRGHSIGVLKKLVGAVIVAAAAAGSVQYYSEVLNNGGLLRYVREPGFQNVCRELEKIKNKRVLVFETLPLLTPWLCYHARHNDVYFDARLISESSFPDLDPFSQIPDLVNVDFVVTRDRIVDLRAPSVTCLALVDDPIGEDKRDGHVFYGIGPPADLRFLALRPISANLKMRLGPGPKATAFPIDFFLADGQGHVSQGEIRAKTVDVRRVSFPRGLSTLQLSVKAKDDDPNTVPSFPIVAELDDLELSEIVFDPGR